MLAGPAVTPGSLVVARRVSVARVEHCFHVMADPAAWAELAATAAMLELAELAAVATLGRAVAVAWASRALAALVERAAQQARLARTPRR